MKETGYWRDAPFARQAVTPELSGLLCGFTREQLREYARRLGVERGQNKSDTICNLAQSGKAHVCVLLTNSRSAEPSEPGKSQP